MDFLARLIAKTGMTANQVTWLAFVLGILSASSLTFKWNLLAIFLLWLSGLMDVLDGTVARLKGTSSKKGAYMDLILDRMVEASIILAFYFAYPESTFAYLLFFVAVLFNFTTFIVAGALYKNDSSKSMHYDFGLAERTETFITFSLMMVFPGWINYILMTFNVIVFITGLIRFTRMMREG
jgi:phosphatidylglycerophosphate synthase